MFIAQAFKYYHDFWRYLVGSLIVIIASFIGQIPFMVAVFADLGLEKLQAGVSEKEMMTTLEANLNLFLLLLSFVFAMAAIFLVTKFLHKQPFKKLTTTRKKVDWKRILFSFTLVALFVVGSTYYDYYTHPESYVINFQPVPFVVLCVIAVVMVPIQTSVEEYIFRGYLMQGFGVGTKHIHFSIGMIITLMIIFLLFCLNLFYDLSILFNFIITIIAFSVLILVHVVLQSKNLYNKKSYLNFNKKFQRKLTPLLITSIIFGGLHFFNPEVTKLGNIIMVYYIGTGLFLGVITLMDEGMELALGFHAANNLVAALLVTADWTVFQTESILKDISNPTAGLQVILPVFIIYPIFLIIFAKVYKWKNWKEKLVGKIEKPQSVTE